MFLGEFILKKLSRDPRKAGAVVPEPPVEQALDEWRDYFPDLEKLVRNGTVVDFGCGNGRQAVALALAGARRVLGLDIQPACLRNGAELAARYGVSDRCVFADSPPPEFHRRADVVLSKDSMEHFDHPVGVLEAMKELLAGPECRILITFCPTWYSPYGAHMNYFTPVPWVHLIFSERTVMKVRALYRDDGARRYHEVPGGLNRMGITRFERTVRASGLRMIQHRYRAVRGLPLVASVPGLRELLVTRVDCVLAP